MIFRFLLAVFGVAAQSNITYTAIATFRNTSVSGTITLTQNVGKVVLEVNMSGLTPNSTQWVQLYNDGELSQSSSCSNPFQNVSVDSSGLLSAKLEVEARLWVISRAVGLGPSKCQATSKAVFGWKNGTAIPAQLQALPATSYMATLFSANSSITGTAVFSKSGSNVSVTIVASGAPPLAVLGIHVHAFGDLSSPTADALGSHFNPFNTSHGCPIPFNSSFTQSHAGDLGNLVFDANGKVNATIVVSGLSLAQGDGNWIGGRSVSIHANTDDCITSPSGNSGKRLCQGVIGISAEAELYTGNILASAASKVFGALALFGLVLL